MDKSEIIERLKNIAGYAVYTVGEKPFVMSLDDGIAVHEAIKLLEKTKTNCSEIPNNWIPCSERLPEPEKKEYWVCTNDGEQCQCRWTNTNHIWTNFTTDWHWHIGDVPRFSKVVAWRPLPEPYKEGGEQE